MDKLFNLIKENNYDNTCLITKSEDIFALFVHQLNTKEDNILVVTPTIYEATKLYNSISAFSDNVYLFLSDDFISNEALTSSPELKIGRLETISKIIDNKKNILVLNLDAYIRFLPKKELFLSKILRLKIGDEIDRDSFVKKLINTGYIRESLVTKTGEFAVRGFIIDIFPIDYDYPIRIEFFDNEIDSIRYFDPVKQNTIGTLDNVKIIPNTEFFNDDGLLKNKFITNYYEAVSIASYLNNPLVYFKDYINIIELYEREIKQTIEYNDPDNYNGEYFLRLEDLHFRNAHFNSLDDATYFNDYKIIKIYSENVPYFNDNIELLNAYIEKKLNDKKYIIICLNDKQIISVSKYLNIKYSVNKTIDKYGVYLLEKEIENGFIYGEFIVLSAKNLFKKINKKRYKTKFKYTVKIKDIAQINIGDYVVHDIHGIGRYEGIKSLKQNNIIKDYLDIKYAGKDRLYIPADRTDLIAKYSANEGLIPKLSVLGGSSWEKTKNRVTIKAMEMANELINLYAKRKMQKGYAFSKDDELETMFDNDFKYDETSDQIKATKEIKDDMEKAFPMDRLLCGDVGYGKTEVAFKAMFKAVKDGKQVMYLCPTTILSSQQYYSSIERYKNVPCRIELLNRFTPAKDKKKIIDDFNNGYIDILIGTHRILSSDVKAKDLGLLVIDEEQRFGVKQKEIIKKYKNSIDVLTLSATPIPRTLQMSLMGIRGLSLLETPPAYRYPVQTYVTRENELIIKDAIYKELSREGQVFILYNKVKDIEDKYNELKTLVPTAKIVVAHGQLTKQELEKRMLSFINNEYDVMLCTTIIETGIDISNVNTLIVYDADKFGLSQLYQIRGRVGRSDKLAYAYLLYQEGKILSEEATKRLKAIKEFTELGSGFKIASRDLSIRGAGDILGSEQAGFIDQVGVDLYMRILNKEIEKIKNGNFIPKEEIDKEITLLNVATHISDNYTDDEDIKILIHKKISAIKTKEDLENLKLELEDRFGKVDDSIQIYMLKEYFEKNAYKKHINKIVEKKNEIDIYFDQEFGKNIDGNKLFNKLIGFEDVFRFRNFSNNLIISINLKKIKKHFIYYLVDFIDMEF